VNPRRIRAETKVDRESSIEEANHLGTVRTDPSMGPRFAEPRPGSHEISSRCGRLTPWSEAPSGDER